MTTLIPERLKRQLKNRVGVPSMEAGLQNLRANGFTPNLALDIGAYQGEWTILCKQIWPACSVLMLEAAPARMPKLHQLAAS